MIDLVIPEPEIAGELDAQARHTLTYPVRISVTPRGAPLAVDAPPPRPHADPDGRRRRRWVRRSAASASIPATEGSDRRPIGNNRGPVHSRLGGPMGMNCTRNRGAASSPTPSIDRHVSQETPCGDIEVAVAAVTPSWETTTLAHAVALVLEPSSTIRSMDPAGPAACVAPDAAVV